MEILEHHKVILLGGVINQLDLVKMQLYLLEIPPVQDLNSAHNKMFGVMRILLTHTNTFLK